MLWATLNVVSGSLFLQEGNILRCIRNKRCMQRKMMHRTCKGRITR